MCMDVYVCPFLWNLFCKYSPVNTHFYYETFGSDAMCDYFQTKLHTITTTNLI